jgi:hypothetical protein
LFEGAKETHNGGMGAVGGLSSMRAQLDTARDDDFSYFDASVAIYADELAICDGQTICVANFLTHFRPAACRNGIVARVCAIRDIDPPWCANVIALRTGDDDARPLAPVTDD